MQVAVIYKKRVLHLQAGWFQWCPKPVCVVDAPIKSEHDGNEWDKGQGTGDRGGRDGLRPRSGGIRVVVVALRLDRRASLVLRPKPVSVTDAPIKSEHDEEAESSPSSSRGRRPFPPQPPPQSSRRISRPAIKACFAIQVGN